MITVKKIKGRKQLHYWIYNRNFMLAVSASSSEDDKTDNRDIVIPFNKFITVGAMGTRLYY